MPTLFLIQTQDAQDLAEQKLGRELTETELRTVKRCVEAGLGEVWHDVLKIAIDEAVDPNLSGFLPAQE